MKHLSIKKDNNKVIVEISPDFYNFFYNRRYYLHENRIKCYSSKSILDRTYGRHVAGGQFYRVLIGGFVSTLLKDKCLSIDKSYRTSYEYDKDFYEKTNIILAKMFEYFKSIKQKERVKSNALEWFNYLDYGYVDGGDWR